MGFEAIKKVAVVTIVGRSNYGNRLQNYAAVKIWENLGYEVDTLELPIRPSLSRWAKDLILKLLGKSTSNPELSSSKERLASFDRFDEGSHLRKISKIEDISINDYSYFSVGSDQVWNPGVFNQRENLFFLKFAKPEQRIALAPSIACETLPPELMARLSSGVMGFPRLSVREERGAEIIWECSGRKADVICDPTLLLSAEEWRAVADGRCTPSGEYVFAYLLGGMGAESSEMVDQATKHGKMPVIFLSDRQKPGEPDAGPAEFIDLIDNASHVVTDSFHAAVFSAIMHTPLTIVHREGGLGMFSRMDQLSKMLGINEKVYGSPTFAMSRAGEYPNVDKAIRHEQTKFMAYLNKCLK